MAQLFTDVQEFVDLRNGTIIGIHQVTLQSASDTLRIPNLRARATFANSVAQVRDEDETSLTLTAGNKNTVTLAGGSAGDRVTIITRHGSNVVNFGDDDSSSPPVSG
jgi:hypothetical protein